MDLIAQGAGPENYVEAIPQIANEAVPAATSIATAPPALMNLSDAGEIGPAAANQATFNNPPQWTPEPAPGLASEPEGPGGFNPALAEEPGAGPAKPPTAWESIKNIPGQWWQGVQASPARLGNELASSPFKALGTGALLGYGAYNAFNPPEAPAAPTFNFGGGGAPRSAFDGAPKPGAPRSPIVGGGGFGVTRSGGVKKSGGFNV